MTGSPDEDLSPPSLRPHTYAPVLAGILLLYVAASIGVALTKQPFCDEGWLASPGLNLIRTGSMHTSAIDPAGSYLKGIDRYTYWVMPLYILGLAAWYQLVGFGLLSMRLFSSLWGIVGLLSTFVFVRALSGRTRVALLASGLLALDYYFVVIGSAGRMDMMAAAAGLAAYAAYVTLRQRSLTWGIAASHALVTIGIMAHPNAIISFCGLVVLTLALDVRRLRWRHVGLAAAPYLIALAAWGAYIAREPAAFVAQFLGNVQGEARWTMFTAPGMALWRELTDRYLIPFGLAPETTGLKRLQAVSLLLYVAGALAAVSTPGLRARKQTRILLILLMLSLALLAVLDGIKRTFYLVYVLPLFAAVLATAVEWYWSRRLLPRTVIALVIGSSLVLQIGGLVRLIVLNGLHRNFIPVVRFIEAAATPDAIVMGPSELGFELGFGEALVDDFRLGYDSGVQPDLIVIDDNYRAIFRNFAGRDPAVDEHIRRTLEQRYEPAYHRNGYVVYTRRGRHETTASSGSRE